VVDSDWQLTQNVLFPDPTFQKIRVQGSMINSSFRSRDDMGYLRIGAMIDSSIFAGVDTNIMSGFVDSTDLMFNSRIESLTIDTPRGDEMSFVNSYVIADVIGSTSLGSVDVGNGRAPFGIAANTFERLSYRIGRDNFFYSTDSPSDTQLLNDDFQIRAGFQTPTIMEDEA
jgi:hypothetical protein